MAASKVEEREPGKRLRRAEFFFELVASTRIAEFANNLESYQRVRHTDTQTHTSQVVDCKPES